MSREGWKQWQDENPAAHAVTVDSSPQALNPEQRKLYDTVVDQYSQEVDSNVPLPRQLLLNVDGVAGSGKTFAPLKACARIQELAIEAGKPTPSFGLLLQASLPSISLERRCTVCYGSRSRGRSWTCQSRR